ncbi:type 1 glutamine amidotransferase [Salsipaludibacter albus]|uniref:type 1 glutamine amidotransferase n=1 Tax=Salsipaludibacter albus TaxID=2849650 RepID=UPI001EE4B976|nr:aminotransferase [Salsipaludibacter albus]MBY5162978.1 aminotransferase [Salsipaludibacter albus]
MRVVFLQHDPGSRPGLLGDALVDRGATVERLAMAPSIHDATFTGPLPVVGDHDLVVPLGAIWSVYDTARLSSWIDRELAWLGDLDRAGVPVLGVCFGGQALAAAHGGTVEPMGTMDIGWSTVTSTDPHRIPAGPWMQWHGDRFLPPPDATVLATSSVGVQAFTLRRNLGLQFHPEVTTDIVGHWMDLGGPHADAAAEAAGTSRTEVLADTSAQRDRARADIDTILDWWLPTVDLG